MKMKNKNQSFSLNFSFCGGTGGTGGTVNKNKWLPGGTEWRAGGTRWNTVRSVPPCSTLFHLALRS
jgi:hypothetical protein